MSMEISSDILAVSEKCRWKFPATIKLCEKNVGGNFRRHFGCERKMSSKFFFSYSTQFFFFFTKHLARYMDHVLFTKHKARYLKISIYLATDETHGQGTWKFTL